MAKRAIYLALLVIPLLVSTGYSQDGLALMKVEVGARPAGMGGAFVAITSDPNASFYNPAGAGFTDKFMTSVGHNTYWENIRLETIYFASNGTKNTWIHGGIRYATVSDMEFRLVPSAEPDSYFSLYDVSFKGGLARRIGQKLVVGVSLGWFIEKIDIYRGSVFNADLGAIYEVKPGMTLGASATNIGSDISLSVSSQPGTTPISIPTTYRFGGASQHGWGLGAVDLVFVDDDAHLHIGVEREMHELFDLRAGYMFGYDSKNFSAGVSFKQRKLTIDYAFVPYSNSLGTAHLFNLTFIL